MACRNRPGLANADYELCLTALAMMSAWMAQIIFWQIVGWQISFRMNLLWIALPVSTYFFSAVAAAAMTVNIKASTGRLFPSWLLACGWMALMACFVALGIRYKSIAFLSAAAALFGVGQLPLSRHAAFCLQRGQPKFILSIFMMFGIGLALAVTSGTLFVGQHLLQLTIALVCCLAIALCAIRIQTMLNIAAKKPVIGRAETPQRRALAWSVKYAGCGVLMAAPIALAPTLEVLCGAKPAGFNYVFLAHYGAMLLPGILGFEWQHAISRYIVLTVYAGSVILGHIAPFLYVSGIGRFAVNAY